MSLTSGRVVQSSKALGVTPQEVKIIKQAAEKRRLRELILREHARQAHMSIHKITAMRQQLADPPASSPGGGQGGGSPLAPTTDRGLQGVTVKEVHQHIDGLRKVASAMAAAAGDVAVVKPTVGSRLLAVDYDQD